MLPIMVGVLGASIGAGRLVSKYGRYKYLVVGGTGLLTLGMWLFSYLTLTTPWTALIPFMLVLGVGLGVCMQQLVVATQNAVPVQDMGTATSSITFFRSMGGAFGTSLFGAILVARLNYWIPRLLPVGAQRLNAHSVTAAPAALHALPPPIRHGIASAFVHALHPLFVVGTPIAGLGFLLAWLLREIKLRETAGLSRDVDALPGGAVAEGAWSEQRKAEAGSVALPAPTEP
jgi:MFS family permease